MKLRTQRRIAAQLLKCGETRIKFDETKLSEIKEAITKSDVRGLIKDDTIQKKPVVSISGGRSRKILKQKRKGRRQGPGSRKGKKGARLPKKEAWMNKIRIMRSFLAEVRDKKLITPVTYRSIYMKAKGGFFRSKRHIKLYLEEHKLIQQNETVKTRTTKKKKS